MPKQRADVALVERGFFESRARAQEAIAAGLVFADGKLVQKASEPVLEHTKLQAEAPHPWVSRGGVKLNAALEKYPVPVSGCMALDVGSSTGGFTHVLLSRGARRVVAVDVGHDQFHASLRGDPRVDLREGTDARSLRAEDLPQPPSVLTFDVSFIPLKPVLSHVLPLAAPGAWMVALVKPQFEAGRQHLKKGIVRDAAVRETALMELHTAVEDLGWSVEGAMPSPIAGGDGNIEFLLVARLRTPLA
jgi:23S rRNA (cytidine1920-2'-O)/16S rRNA (cytidine1409-2'-O)-methyltransferase